MHDDKPTIPHKRDILGRITTPKAQREALLDEFERSGLKGRPFAKLVGVNYQTFAVWIQKRRRARGDYAQAAAVKSVGASAVRTPRPLRLIEAIAAPLGVALPMGAVGKSEALEVILPDGAKLLIANAAHAALAAQLISALRAPC
jgi:hypothetical protein